jgi:hypothetical protein
LGLDVGNPLWEPSEILTLSQTEDLLSRVPPPVVGLAVSRRGVGLELDRVGWQRLFLLPPDSRRWHWPSESDKLKRARLPPKEFVERLRVRGLTVRVVRFGTTHRVGYRVTKDPALALYHLRKAGRV